MNNRPDTDETPTPEWDWDHHDQRPYTYPADAHISPRPSGHPCAYPGTLPADTTDPGIDLGTVLLLLTGLIVAAALIAATLLTDHDEFTAGAATTPVLASLPAATGATATPATRYTAPTKSVPLDPYRASGRWYIGTDIPPGRYRVIVTGLLGGYWERCTDLACAPGEGLAEARTLAYGAPEGILDVLASDYLVKTSGVELIPE